MTERTVRMDQFGHLLLTRERAREVAATFSRSAKQLTLDFDSVQAASPSFLDELMKRSFKSGVKQLRFVNLNEQSQRSVNRLQERRPDNRLVSA